MNTLISLLTICVVVILYIHVVHQLKTSNDLEIFELDTPIQSRLEEICNLRQPLLFPYYEENIAQCSLPRFMEYKAFDVTVYDSSFVPSIVSLNKAFQLIKKKTYISIHNSDFLQETTLYKQFLATDAYLRPPMVSNIQYDVLFGSDQSTTRLEYSTYYRNYLYVSDGSIQVKLAPPRSSKYLHIEKNYTTQEYYSTLHPWNTSFDKIKFLEVTVTKGQMLFIPSYWWYSIQFTNNSCVCTLQYRTVMNLIATLPDICMGILERQNTKTKLKINHFSQSASSSVSSHTSTALDELP
jgi:hypothetical protein